MAKRFMVLLAAALVAGDLEAASPASKPPTASRILQASEAFRSPDADYAIDFTITVRDDRFERPVRTAEYAMVVHGRDRAMVRMLTSSSPDSGSLMISAGEYWLLLPRADRPQQLWREQVVRGDVAHGDLARSNLPAEYEPRLDGVETIDGEQCHRLELTRKLSTARYPRIVSWVAVRSLLPRKLELYSTTGALLRTARYHGFHKTPAGVIADRIEVTSGIDPHESTTIAFSEPRPVDVTAFAFTPDGLVAFRSAVLARSTR